MTTRVLMVGKSNEVMAQMATDMGPEFAVTHTEDVHEAASKLNSGEFDAVILGRALKSDGKQVLSRALEQSDGRLTVLTSLAPVGKLSAAHTRAAMSATTGRTILTNARISGGELLFELTAPANVTVTLYSLTALRYILKINPIRTDSFPPGEHRVRIPASFASAFERKHLYAAADNGDAWLIKVPGLL